MRVLLSKKEKRMEGYVQWLLRYGPPEELGLLRPSQLLLSWEQVGHSVWTWPPPDSSLEGDRRALRWKMECTLWLIKHRGVDPNIFLSRVIPRSAPLYNVDAHLEYQAVRTLCRVGMRCPTQEHEQRTIIRWFSTRLALTERDKTLAKLLMDIGLIFSRERAAVIHVGLRLCNNCTYYVECWNRRQSTLNIVLRLLSRDSVMRRKLGRDATALVARALWILRYAESNESRVSLDPRG